MSFPCHWRLLSLGIRTPSPTICARARRTSQHLSSKPRKWVLATGLPCDMQPRDRDSCHSWSWGTEPIKTSSTQIQLPRKHSALQWEKKQENREKRCQGDAQEKEHVEERTKRKRRETRQIGEEREKKLGYHTKRSNVPSGKSWWLPAKLPLHWPQILSASNRNTYSLRGLVPHPYSNIYLWKGFP